MRLLLIASLAAVSLLLQACPQPVPTPEDEACEHLAEGPSTPVTAVTEGDGPLIADDHRRYDVTLVPTSGGNGGRVRFAADEAGDFIFFTSVVVPITLTDAAGNAVEVEQTLIGSEVCSEIAARIIVPLGVGTYHLELGPVDQTLLSFVVEHGGGHEE
ncbi:MAG: hypothetical protein M3Y59_11165 [Myxococcota bacterium]|nr:hypothetical protein [Myxococcota bacterium]